MNKSKKDQKTFTSEEVSEIISKRVNKMNEKMDELKEENQFLKDVLISAFKDWFKEQKDKEGNENDGH